MLSYWRKAKEVGKEKPAGDIWPEQLSAVTMNGKVPRRFNLVFKEKNKIMELLAPSVEECCRWVRGLNSRGIQTVKQTRRMSATEAETHTETTTAAKQS